MNLHEIFAQPTLPPQFTWFNPPARYQLGAGLQLETRPQTDFWQGTHYGFRRDDGHCLLTRLAGDFCLSTQVAFAPQAKYDQCGLMIRLNAQNWIKASTEYEDEAVSRLGSVVTNLGYSDWATQDISASIRKMWYRISKRGQDFLIESSFDGRDWRQLRIAHMHSPLAQVQAGVYACSPVGQAFCCTFYHLTVSQNTWLAG